MPDITMCRNEECNRRNECYRFVAKPSLRQSYCLFPEQGDECKYFVKIEAGDEIRKESTNA